MEPSREPTTFLVLSRRKPGLTFDEYKTYYENTHVKLVQRLILDGPNGPLSYSRLYIERDSATPSSAPPSFPFGGVETWEYDCVARVTLRDVAHREALFKEFEQHRAEIEADEENFLDRASLRIIWITDTPANVRK